MINNFLEIYSYQSVYGKYPGLNADIIANFYNSIGKELLIKIAYQFIKDPYLYQKAWPDLMLPFKGKVKFVEIKTSDRLRESLAIIICDFAKPLGLDFYVLKVKKSNEIKYA